ncbi:hypothetical protein EF847_17670 [Actinobacteria bacterium YIM 96077]|uniref:Hydrogenase expression protein n=1 Tax=Phytoactinopolyspora halophila TaxID=1981511 RepID=A0A329QR11_9ACTN|nr:AIR synthase related protein [Phytoactinopolyspora halophila]AYY14252.1 hypothetical protein EF847_17670 [Actinobacteria bacterium YIM 96077]RAW14794.1 hypothetical protein DPM12_09885 [Phytoactinopolyspora halophila]
MAPSSIPAGKLPAALLAEQLASFGPAPGEVRLGPAVGEDACAIDIADGTLVAATDPITLTTSDAGRYAVLINANDVAVSGVCPRWFLAAVLLPEGTTEHLVETLFTTMREALAEVGATLVGGHTEVTSAVTQPLVVGQMLGFAPDGRVLSTAGAAPGEVLVQIGMIPVEGAAVLANEAVTRLTDLTSDVLAGASHASRVPGISVVDAALAARDLGATAMHDPTEGGLAAGLHEFATAAGVALRIDPRNILWFEPGLAVCRALGADPLGTLASGSLLATFPASLAADAVGELRSAGHLATALGEVDTGTGVHDTDGGAIGWPERDEVARVLAD